jgi:hypothetical protein
MREQKRAFCTSTRDPAFQIERDLNGEREPHKALAALSARHGNQSEKISADDLQSVTWPSKDRTDILQGWA